MAVHPIDYQLLPPVFADPDLATVFSEEARLQRWLDFEAALAASQAELGIVPAEAAAAIQAAARLDRLDADGIRRAYQGSSNSLVPLLTVLRRACGAAGRWVHHGATTQDVLDTAQVLEQRQAVTFCRDKTERICRRLHHLARRHRDTVAVARTHGQQALPTTFGLKAAGWLVEFRRHHRRLAAQDENFRYGQLGGAAGTLAALGEDGLEVARRTLARLGLEAPLVPWHNQRDTVAELAGTYGLVLGGCQRLANDLYQLARTEIGEVREGGGKGPASSTMTHKNNPVRCQRVSVLGDHGRALVATVLAAMIHEHERDPRRLWSEWLAMGQLAIYTGTALALTLEVLNDLQVDEVRMAVQVEAHNDTLLSEHLTLGLAQRLGRERAQAKVKDWLHRVAEGDSLAALVAADPETRWFAPQMQKARDYTGLAGILVDRVLAAAPEFESDDDHGL